MILLLTEMMTVSLQKLVLPNYIVGLFDGKREAKKRVTSIAASGKHPGCLSVMAVVVVLLLTACAYDAGSDDSIEDNGIDTTENAYTIEDAGEPENKEGHETMDDAGTKSNSNEETEIASKDDKGTGNTSSPEDETDSELADTAKIKPLSRTLFIESLNDCIFAASFGNSDIELGDEGILFIHMTVYDYELFDLVDISRMEEGDTLFINGQDMLIHSLERPEHDQNGTVVINGGTLEGGTCLVTDENGVFYEVIPDIGKRYFSIGEVTLPVRQDFIFQDRVILDGPDQVYSLEELITHKDSADFTCTNQNTSVRVENGWIVSITRK